MKTKIARIAQATLLLAALALMAVSFVPAPAEAYPFDSCRAACDGGSYNCGGYTDPVSGAYIKCTLSCT